MLNEYINTQSPIAKNTGFLFSEERTLYISKPSWQRTEILLKFGWSTSIMVEGINYPFGRSKKNEISNFPIDTSTLLKLVTQEEIESGLTQELANRQEQRLAFPSYDEEDILKLDAVTVAPPPRRSGTIRVKLIPKGRSKPIPAEDPWEV